MIPGAANAIIAPATKYAIKIAESAAIGEKLALVSEALAPMANAFNPAFALEAAEGAALKTAGTELRALKTIESLEKGVISTAESTLAKESTLEKSLTQSNKGISAEKTILNQTNKIPATEEPLLAKVKSDPVAELTTLKNMNSLERGINSSTENALATIESEISAIRSKTKNIWHIDGKNIDRMNAEKMFSDSKLGHIFEKTEHGLNQLKLSPDEVYTKLTEVIVKADRAGEIPINIPFTKTIPINGYNVEVRAIILNGELKYNTFYIPK